ncbi:MAG: T9SS type A sorting domain-containing protein [Bacteroidetes bacterium]|nr:T9SS type A sorting domain-containing protein [Bacteroidota bacterium]
MRNKYRHEIRRTKKPSGSNPVKGKIHYEFESGEYEKTDLIIYGIAISQVFHKENIFGKEQISTSKFNSGIYIVKVINTQFTETKRLVIY